MKETNINLTLQYVNADTYQYENKYLFKSMEGNMVYLKNSEERHVKYEKQRAVVAALCEAKVKDDEVLRLLKNYCDSTDEEAVNLLQCEKFIEAPCRTLFQNLVLDVGMSEREADDFIYLKAKVRLSKDTALSKLAPAKLYAAIK